MKIAAFSDPHFHAFKSHSTMEHWPGWGMVNSRLSDAVQTFNAMVELAIEQEAELMVCCGDVFNTRGVIKPSVFNVVYHTVKRAAAKIPFVMIPGNHDMEFRKGGSSSIDTLAEISGVYVMCGPSTLTLRGLTIAGIPYCNTLQEFEEAVAKIENLDEAGLILTHQGVDNFAPAGMPAFGYTVEKMQEFFGTKRPVCCGHYHNAGRRENIIQVGAPMQHTFGDEGQERGFWMIGCDDGQAVHCQLSLAPRFMTIDQAEEVREETVGGHIVRVKGDNATTVKRLAALCMKAGAIDAVCIVERVHEKREEAIIEVGTVNAMLKQYIELTKPEHGEEMLTMHQAICS